MKHITKLLFFFVAVLGLASCEKDENRIYLEGGTAPMLSVSSTAPQMLLRANASKPALTFNWTNPNYQFTTGVSSQDVTYVLQVDSAGKNFSSSMKQEVSISRDLSKTFTVNELNGILSRMELAEDKAHSLEFRIKSTLIAGNAPLESNVIKLTLTPYLDVAVPVPPTGELYITGNAVPSDWTNTPPAAQKFTKVNSTLYEITMAFVAGKEYKFLSTSGAWQPQYGTTNATGTELGGDIGFNMGSSSDPAAIKTPAVSGNYKITVNFRTGKYTVVKL